MTLDVAKKKKLYCTKNIKMMDRTFTKKEIGKKQNSWSSKLKRYKRKAKNISSREAKVI